MALIIKIAGVDRTVNVLWQGFYIRSVTMGLGSAELQVKNLICSSLDSVQITLDGTDIFLGHIIDTSGEFEDKDTYIQTVRCTEKFSLPYSSFSFDYSAGDHTEKQILTDLMGLWSPNPIGAHVINGDLVSIIFAETSFLRMLNDLAGVNNRIWYWGPDDELHYFASTGETAPFNFSDSPNYSTTFPYGRLRPRSSYENSATITGGSLICWENGLHAGMAIAITNTKLSWSALSFVINEVEMRRISATEFEYTVHFGDVKKPRVTDLIVRTNKNVSTVDRGIVPPLENDETKFFRSDGTYGVPAGTTPKLDDCGAPDDNTDLNASTSKHGLLKKLSNVATEFLNGQGNWATPAGGSVATDPIWDSVGDLVVGAGSNFAISFSLVGIPDGYLLTRNSLMAYGLHWAAPPKLDDLSAPDDNTDLNASTSKHGLLKKLSNVATEFLNGQGNWATPAGWAPAQYIVTASRAIGTTYQNTTGKAMTVSVTVSSPDVATWFAVGGYCDTTSPLTDDDVVAVDAGKTNSGSDNWASVTFVVPAGSYYKVGNGGYASTTLFKWTEWY